MATKYQQKYSVCDNKNINEKYQQKYQANKTLPGAVSNNNRINDLPSLIITSSGCPILTQSVESTSGRGSCVGPKRLEVSCWWCSSVNVNLRALSLAKMRMFFGTISRMEQAFLGIFCRFSDQILREREKSFFRVVCLRVSL